MILRSLIILLVGLFTIGISGCSTTKKISDVDAEASIHKVMQMQEEAWSDGDIRQFMEGYWKSENLTFVGKSGVNRGWKTTMDNYFRGYPNKTTMGTLSFEVIEMNRLSDKAYHMIGRYTLEREADKPTGLFTLIWRHIDGKWLIVSDHTSG